MHMQIRLVAILWVLLLCGSVRAQVGASDFFLDPVGKAYLLLADDRLVTANPLGGNSYSFYDSSLGSPDLVDVSNPFQILLYYRAYGTVVLLDRTLSELDRIDLFAIREIEQPGAIARSYDNGMWVYDNWNYRLLRLNERGEVDQRTNNLQLELGERSEPTSILVGRSNVMLYYREAGRLAVFSNFGEFQRWVKVPDAARVTWYAPRMLALSDAAAFVWTPADRAFTPLGNLPTDLTGNRKLLLDQTGYRYLDGPHTTVMSRGLPKK